MHDDIDLPHYAPLSPLTLTIFATQFNDIHNLIQVLVKLDMLSWAVLYHPRYYIFFFTNLNNYFKASMTLAYHNLVVPQVNFS